MCRVLPVVLVVRALLSVSYVSVIFNNIFVTVHSVQQQQNHQRSFFHRIIRRRLLHDSTRNSDVAVAVAVAVTAATTTVPSLQLQSSITESIVQENTTPSIGTTGSNSIDNNNTTITTNGLVISNESQRNLETPKPPVSKEHHSLQRPAYVQDLLLQHEEYVASTSSGSPLSQQQQQQPIIYYFGLGSNMLRSKLENRGNGFGGGSSSSNDTSTSTNTTWKNNNTATLTTATNSTNTNNKIEIISMEPAYIQNYRLSFNLRGFCPLEPGMGSLEPIDNADSSSSTGSSNSQPLHSYEEPECHGALIALTLDNYERVMRSEGVGPNVTNPSYEEIVITAIPYNTSKESVMAVALRAREHVRLKQDPSPSQRYMDILQQGAAELQLRPNYQTFLQTHPVQVTPMWLQRLAVYNLICTMSIATTFKWRGMSKIQSFLLYKVYLPCGLPHIMKWQRMLSNICMGTILFPGACMGRIIKLYCSLFNKTFSPMMLRFISMMDTTNTGSTNIPTMNNSTISSDTNTTTVMKLSTGTAAL